MIPKLFLITNKNGEIKKFLSEFYNTNYNLENDFSWSKNFSNPIDLTEFIAAFIDNLNNFELSMWVSLDKNVFVKITALNADYVIKYLFERYPY